MNGDIVVSTAQMQVLHLLKEIGPTTDMDLHYTLNENGVQISQSGVRHRRNRLREKGLVKKTYQVVNRTDGRTLIVWKAK